MAMNRTEQNYSAHNSVALVGLYIEGLRANIAELDALLKDHDQIDLNVELTTQEWAVRVQYLGDILKHINEITAVKK